MKKFAYAVGLSALLLGTTGCSGEEKSNTKSKEVVEAQKVDEIKNDVTTVSKEDSKEPTKLSQEEASRLVEETMERLNDSLQSLRQEYDWTVGYNEPDIKIIRKAIESFCTDELLKNEEQILTEFYAETDVIFIPFYVRPDVRLNIEQKGKELKLDTIELTDGLNTRASVNLSFVYEDEKWKLNGWSSKIPEDIQLTREEAQIIANTQSDHTYEFKEEKQEDGVVHYVFESEENIIHINSATTMVTYPKLEAELNGNKTEQFSEESSNNQTMKLKKEVWEQKLSEVQDKDWSIDRSADFDDVEGWEKEAQQGFQLWDDFLNEIYGALKTNLASNEFEKLRDEQREWLSSRDPIAEYKAVDDVGGTDHPLYNAHVVDRKAQLTFERCSQLIEWYMD